MANPTNIRWRAPDTFEDGTPYSAADHAGFTLYFLAPDGSAASSVAVPVGWNEDGVYSFPVSALNLRKGNYSIALTTVAVNGLESERSNVVAFAIESKPGRPQDLVVE